MDSKLFLEKFSDQFEDAEQTTITLDTSYKNLDSWDSLTAFSVQAMIEDDFGVTLSQEDIKSTNTVQELFDLVASIS